MHRNKGLVVRLLSYIQDRDLDGYGLYRAELKECLESDTSAKLGDVPSALNALDYHLYLAETAGFVIRTPSEEEGDKAGDNFELTWAGHEYLAAEAQSKYLDLTGFN